MRKAIFQRFIVILSLALIISGSIFAVSISSILVKQTRKDLLHSLRIMDQSLNYKEDLKSQVDRYKRVTDIHNIRFTIVDLNGNVLADSDVDNNNSMENHSGREEIQEAMKKGTGYSLRYSGTLRVSMLYVACLSYNGNYILRISIPFSGPSEYLKILLPVIIITSIITLLVSAFLANQFFKTVTKPLNEIANEMLKLKDGNLELQFRPYQFEEMNLIAEKTSQMVNSVKESMEKIEFEKMIRQEFFSNASHELKTPITSIRGYIELMENGMVKDEAMQKDFLLRMKKESVNMTNLINDILMISRLETKEAEVVLSEVRLCPLVNEVCRSLEPLAAECLVAVETNCKPLNMYANENQIRELFNNLITNAIKYNKPGGKVFVTVTSDPKDIIIIVKDTGVGIPEESKQRVFERFYRVDKGRSKKMGGTGLGLSIVKHVVNYYNGSIELDSRIMEGSKFTVRLPKKFNKEKRVE